MIVFPASTGFNHQQPNELPPDFCAETGSVDGPAVSVAKSMTWLINGVVIEYSPEAQLSDVEDALSAINCDLLRAATLFVVHDFSSVRTAIDGAACAICFSDHISSLSMRTAVIANDEAFIDLVQKYGSTAVRPVAGFLSPLEADIWVTSFTERA